VNVRELAGICFGRNRDGAFLALAIRVHFDGSGKEESQPVITVGGFLADEKVCEDIERDWEFATGKKVFHLTDFGTPKCKLDSENWPIPKRREFLKQLASIVNRTGCHILSASVEVAPYNSFLANSPHAHVNGPVFSGCAQAAIAIAEHILKKEKRHKQKVGYVFEKGDRQHEIAKMVNEWDDTNSELSGLRCLSFAPKDTTLLQPADLIAGIIQRCVIAAHQALPCLDNGYTRTALYNYERHYSVDAVTTAVVSGHDRDRCWVINPKTFTVLDRLSSDFFERYPEVLETRLKQSPFKPRPPKKQNR
jgi:hypothetical protein